MSEALTTDQIANPHWTPVYHQELLFPTDMMTQNIHLPGKISIRDQSQVNKGSESQENLTYFSDTSKTMKLRKQRNPYLYDFAPYEPIFPTDT